MPRYAPKKCAEFRKSVEDWRNANKENIQQYHDEHEFVLGSQWEDDEEEILKNYNKIPLQDNQLAPLANHLLGEQRMNTPALEVAPDDNSVDQETVKVRQALVKDISLDSKAKVVYQSSFKQSSIGGYGAHFVDTQYRNNETFEQIPVVTAIKDATRAFWDVGAETPCKTDGMFGGFYSKMSRDLFRKKYGKDIEGKIPPTMTEIEEDSGAAFEWNNDSAITIGRIWKRKFVNSTIYQLSNREIINQEQFDQLEKVNISSKFVESENNEFILFNGEPCTIINQRKVTSYKITQYKWAGDYILDEEEWPGQQIPVVFVDMNSFYDKQGKQIFIPFFKYAKDSQRFVNYLVTQIAYLIKISRYDQYMAPRSNMKSPKTQSLWKNPTVQQGCLVYDDSPNGSKPEPLHPPELSQSLMQQYERATQGIHRSTGIYETRMGEKGNEISGDAIDARVHQTAYNTFVVFDNLNRAIAVTGDIINEMIPKLYNTERTVTLEMPDVGTKTITLNEQADEYGSIINNDMSKGNVKIRLVPGPSYEGQKSQNLQALQLLLQAQPQVFALIADLYTKNLPIPDAIEITNRLRTIVPPEILEAGRTGQPLPPKQPQKDPALMIKMQELALKNKEIQLKEKELQMKAQTEQMDISTQLQELQNERMSIAAEVQDQILRYKAETHRTDTDQQIAHAQNIVELLTRPNHLNQPVKKEKA